MQFQVIATFIAHLELTPVHYQRMMHSVCIDPMQPQNWLMVQQECVSFVGIRFIIPIKI